MIYVGAILLSCNVLQNYNFCESINIPGISCSNLTYSNLIPIQLSTIVSTTTQSLSSTVSSSVPIPSKTSSASPKPSKTVSPNTQISQNYTPTIIASVGVGSLLLAGIVASLYVKRNPPPPSTPPPPPPQEEQPQAQLQMEAVSGEPDLVEIVTMPPVSRVYTQT